MSQKLSLRGQELASVRRAMTGAARELKQFKSALAAVDTRAVRGIQQGAHDLRKSFANRYGLLALYSDSRGVLRRIRMYGVEWGKRKAKLALDMRPGVARKGVLKTLQSPRVIVRTARGFVFDLTAPDITVTGRATISKSKRNLAGKRILAGTGKGRQVVGMGVRRKVTNRRSFRVNNYIDHFARQKAPGLGSIATADLGKLMDAAVQAALKDLRKVQRSQGFHGAAGRAEVVKFVIRLTQEGK